MARGPRGMARGPRGPDTDFRVTPRLRSRINTRAYVLRRKTTAANATPVVVSGLKTGDTVTGLSERFATSDVSGDNLGTLLVDGTFSIIDAKRGQNYAVVTTAATGTIFRRTPQLGLTAGPNVVVGMSVKLTASAALTGGISESGSITFQLSDPNNQRVGTDVATVNSDGTSTTTGFAPIAIGTCQWVASYSGDLNHNGFATTKGLASTIAVAASISVT
jgi:hypothetical protein